MSLVWRLLLSKLLMVSRKLVAGSCGASSVVQAEMLNAVNSVYSGQPMVPEALR